MSVQRSIKTLGVAAFSLAVMLAPGCGHHAPAAGEESNEPEVQPAERSEVKVSLSVGDVAPDFTMRAHTGETVSLSDYRGKKNVILAFYVLAFTGG